jgi:predicted regulator of Ras-like GTPase activity (Roadblock/LC7/MglB family)
MRRGRLPGRTRPDNNKENMVNDKLAVETAVIPILKRLNSTSSDIQASAVMSRDGHTLASVLGEAVNSVRLGAICATLLSLGEKASQELNRGNLRQILIQGEQGYVLLMRIGEKAVLAVVSQPSANLGMMLVEARRTAGEIVALGLV